jgi:hypothetical protein
MWLTSCSHEPGGGLHAFSCFTRFALDAGVPESDLATPDGRPFRFCPPLGSGLPPISSKYSFITSAAVSLLQSVSRPSLRPTPQRTCCLPVPMSDLWGCRSLAISRRTRVGPDAVSLHTQHREERATLTNRCARIFSTTNLAQCQRNHGRGNGRDAYSSGSPPSLSSSSTSSTSSTSLAGFLVGLPFFCAGTASSLEDSSSLRAAAHVSKRHALVRDQGWRTHEA